MDPLSEALKQATNVPLTLLGLGFVMAMQTVALEQIYDTKLWRRYLGKGDDGSGSRLFSQFELRPWVSTAVGIYLAYVFKFQCIAYAYGIDPSQMPPSAQYVDIILTGLIIGGGTKALKKLSKIYAENKTIAGAK